MPSAVRMGLLTIFGALLMAPLTPAHAGHAVQTFETYKGARHYAQARARKVCRQERNYRALETKRLSRLGIPKREQPPLETYASAWNSCTAGPL